MRRSFLTLFFTFLALYLALGAWLYLAQRSILYLPDPTRYTPEDAGFSDMAVVTFQTKDGLTLESWYQEAEPGKPTIVYFHGNAGNLLNHSYIGHPLTQAGYGVLLLEYRGFGGNPGKPTEQGFYADARAAIEFLKGRGLKDKDLVLFGMSLGTGVAVKMAAEITPKALVLQSPYPSIAEVGQHHYWYMPVKWLVRDKFPAKDYIAANSAPLLVLAAENDKVIPFKFSKSLYEAAKKPKTMRIFKFGGHNDLSGNGGPEAVLEFLNQLDRGKG